MQKQGGIFQKWFKEFSMAVFSQSLHAIIFGVMLIMLSNVSKLTTATGWNDNSQTSIDEEAQAQQEEILVSVLAFIAVSSITRLERIVKELFGVGSSSLLGDNHSNTAKAIMGMKSGISMGKNVVSGVKSYSSAVKTKREARDAMAGKTGKDIKFNNKGYAALTHQNKANELAKEFINNSSNETLENNFSPAPDSPEEIVQAAQVNKSRASSDNQVHNAKSSVNIGNGTLTSDNNLQSRLNNSSDNSNLDERTKRKQEMEDWKYEKMQKEKKSEEQALVDKYNSAHKESRTALAKTFLKLGTSIATTSVGGGAFDELSEAVTFGDFASRPFSAGVDAVSSRSENNKIQQATINAANETAEQFKKDMQTAIGADKLTKDIEASINDSAFIISSQVQVSPEFINAPLNSAKVDKQMSKNMQDIQKKYQDAVSNQSIDVKYQVNVEQEQNQQRTINQQETINVNQVVENTKRTKNKELDSLKMLNQTYSDLYKGINRTGNVRGVSYSGKYHKTDNIDDTY